MRVFIFIFALILVFACNQSEKKADTIIKDEVENNSVFIESFKKDFLARVGFMKLKKPYLISSRIFDTYHLLSKEQLNILKVHEIFKSNNVNSKFGMALDIGFSKDFKSFVIYQYDENKQMLYKLANYTNDYKFIDAIDVSYFDLTKKMNATETYVYNNRLFVHNKDNFQDIEYYLNSDGTFKKKPLPITFNYLPLIEYSDFEVYKNTFEQRVVKAKNGLIIRDSLGNKLGKFNYLETISVLEYSKDKIEIDNNGKPIIGQKAKVIINPEELNKEENFYLHNSNIGYVFDGFLFENATTGNDDYRYEGLSINKKHLIPFNLSELLEVEEVNIDNYLNKVIKKPNIKDVTSRYKQGKLVTIKAVNGKQLQFKDTTYQSEYSPTKTFYVSEDSNFENAFIINSQMIFMYQHFDFFNKKNGELLDTYIGGYPHMSPDKSYIVSVDYDAECPNQRTLFIDKIVNNKIIKTLEIHYDIEEYKHLSFVKNKTKNEIFWLSNNEFVFKFWGATGCYSDSDNYFYYRYKIKEHLLDLLEVK
ncbi:hypothetical protein [Ichthyenterobacterium magnum]|uniref:WG repeat protein n=1 Tax=Ichthyenterobacterium magnum TaxID=1230530 RepID=A0A420DLM8_9FLAO|nr:hypothetical protein [Ichthyenterobacterium magnum]RKE95069.1 hypothetical protein BXY80_1252 [Ichthyenterobacterium magnum]